MLFRSVFLACLKKNAEFIVIRVVDNLIEDILEGLERNDYKENQHRILAIRFLGELYQFMVINSELIFGILNMLIDLNNEHKYPDAKDDGFRIRMVCTVLETCGKKFEKGEKRLKLDTYLRYLERYLLSKSYLSIDLQFLILDTYEMLRPDMTLCKTYEEAVEECKRIETEGAKMIVSEEETKEKPEDNVEEESKIKEDESEPIVSPTTEEENLKEYDRGNINNKLDDELKTLIEEYQKEAKKQIVIKKMDVPVPVIKKDSEGDSNSGKFAVMMKKGTKQIVKKIEIPIDSKLSIAHQKHVNEEEEERLRMKELTMNMLEREEILEMKSEYSAEMKQKSKADDQLAKGKKKIHYNYKDFDS